MIEEISIIQDNLDWLPVTIPGAEGTHIKVYKADPVNDRVVARIKFQPGAQLPRHIHHCRAVAYTLQGEWSYDEGDFAVGDVAYEHAGNDHTPYSKDGAEMIIVFDGKNGKYLDNIIPGVGVISIDMPFFEALEGISLEQYKQVNPHELVEVIAEPREVEFH